MSTNWDIGQLTGQTYQKLLTPLILGDMKSFLAFTNAALQYPCVNIRWSVAPYTGLSGWNKYKAVLVEIEVMTEAADKVDATGVIVQPFEEIHTIYLNSVMNALCPDPFSDAPISLLSRIQAAAVPGVAFSMALVGNWTPSIDTAGTNRIMKTTITIDTVAEPVRVGA